MQQTLTVVKIISPPSENTATLDEERDRGQWEWTPVEQNEETDQNSL